MTVVRTLSWFAVGAIVLALSQTRAADTPVYRPSPNSQPPVYQTKTVPPATQAKPPTMSPAARAACTSLKEMIAVVRRSRMTSGGAILPTEGAAFSSPGASACTAKAGVAAGSANARCVYAASSKADAEAKRGHLIAHTKDCLTGWPSGSTAESFMFQSADRKVMGGVQIVEDAGKFSVERSAYYDAAGNPVVQDANCDSLSTMQKHVAANFASAPMHKLPSGGSEFDTPVAHATMCYAFPRGAITSAAGLSCTWVVEDKDPNGPGKEVLARGFYQRLTKMVTTCRAGQAVQPATPLGNGELASQATSNGSEMWSVKLLGPDKGAPWAVMLTLKQK
jgi:hypothetical protein